MGRLSDSGSPQCWQIFRVSAHSSQMVSAGVLEQKMGDPQIVQEPLEKADIATLCSHFLQYIGMLLSVFLNQLLGAELLIIGAG